MRTHAPSGAPQIPDAASDPLALNSMERRLLATGMALADILENREKVALIHSASICSASSGLFYEWAYGRIANPSHAAQAGELHAALAALPKSDREKLSTLIQQAAALGKPSKMGVIAAEARKIAGPLYGHVACCMLSAMGLSMTRSAKPMSELASLISIVARGVNPAFPAHPMLASSLATRCCYSSSPSLLECMLENGASPGGCDSNGHTPLTLACRHSMRPLKPMDATEQAALECVALLIQAGADIDEPDGRAQTPLGMAAMQGFHPACALLLSAGADIFAPPPERMPPILDMLLALEPTRAQALSVAERSELSGSVAASPAARRPRGI